MLYFRERAEAFINSLNLLLFHFIVINKKMFILKWRKYAQLIFFQSKTRQNELCYTKNLQGAFWGFLRKS